MIKVKETIIVEGKYDKIKLTKIVDANIIECDGYAIFSDKEKVNLLRALAKKDGILVLTDSDRAGFLIRGYITQCIKEGSVKHAYIPEILGKERRKVSPSKEGTLGVEGVDDSIILNALEKAGITPQQEEKQGRQITVSDLYDDGLCGREGSFEKRKALLKSLELPKRVSTKALLVILNRLYSYDVYKEEIDEINNDK